MSMRFIYLWGQIFFLPHLVLYIFSSNKEEIKKDLYKKRYFPKSSINLYNDLTKELLLNKYFRTLFYFRISNFYAKILRLFFPGESSFIIDVYSEIKGGVHLAHPFSTIINAEYIGENLYINQLVTVGEKNGKKPRLGNNVELHANSIVIGGIEIGNNVTIGAGAVVVKNVPDNAIVAGNPAKIIRYKNN